MGAPGDSALLIDSGHFDLDLDATGKDVESHEKIPHEHRGRHATRLMLWAVSTGDSDPSTAVVQAFSVITDQAPREAFDRLTADAAVALAGGSQTDLDVSRRTHTYIKITTAEANKTIRLYYALFDNRSI